MNFRFSDCLCLLVDSSSFITREDRRMACDMTHYLMNHGSYNYRPYVPTVSKKSNNYRQPADTADIKLINICRCACRNIQLLAGGLSAT